MKRLTIASLAATIFAILQLIAILAAEAATPLECANDSSYFKKVFKKGGKAMYWPPNISQQHYRIKDDKNIKDYTMINIDPIMIWYHPKTGSAAITPADLSTITEYIRNSILERMNDVYSTIKASNGRSLQLRVAITGIIHKNDSNKNGAPKEPKPKKPSLKKARPMPIGLPPPLLMSDDGIKSM